MRTCNSLGGRSRRSLSQMVLLLACGLIVLPALATTVNVGTLSYDTFIPASNVSPGVDAFNLSNLTGSFDLAPDFPVTDSLTFEAATLTLTLTDLSQEVFTLGDIGPGFLLDMGGNPVVQVSGDQSFISAEFTATLFPLTFGLSDGTLFTAASSSIDVQLLPSTGSTLTADVDQTTIGVTEAVQSTVPEPATGGIVFAFMTLAWWSRRQ